MNACPKCGGGLETYLRIDLDGVELSEPDEHGRRTVTSFFPARSANDDKTGIVVEEATITCCECGGEVDEAYVPYEIMDHWVYR